MKQSKVEFKQTLPNPATLGPSNLLIYDLYFAQKSPALKATQAWIKKFPFRIGFTSGEPLKDLKKFPQRMEQILALVSEMAIKDVQIIALGGGSLGDFAGFVASVLKRGLPLVHIPTTWLSAMDSAHGGKTALNVAGFKNQIGSFYPAEKIILCKSILFQQPPTRSQEAFGEALKMALLTGRNLWPSFSRLNHFSNKEAWIFLPQLVAGKYHFVKKDPFEKKGLRHLLNLGHTLGHVWEASLRLPHGIAVAYGIRAAIELSLQEKILSPKEHQKLLSMPVMNLLPSPAELGRVSKKSGEAREYLLKDKKISKRKTLRFIFIERPGKCVIKDISIEKLLKFHRSLQRESNP